ncbi:MAG: sel1 repeat family protein [Rhodospirillaceae bacterium]|nr:sel1 repeat family protein [Rhodospirillaceae bacterium]
MHKLLCVIVGLVSFSFAAYAQDEEINSREPAALAAAADRYASGDGVVQSDERAVQLYHQAAELGDARALFRLGEMYGAGRGVIQDDAAAVEYFRAAMARSYGPAMTSLGICYAEGKGVPVDSATALSLLQGAAAAGDQRAKDYLVRARLRP